MVPSRKLLGRVPLMKEALNTFKIQNLNSSLKNSKGSFANPSNKLLLFFKLLRYTNFFCSHRQSIILLLNVF